MGRPTKLTPERAEAILKAIRLGASKEAAAQAAGIAYDTLNNWRLRGEAGGSGAAKYVQFFEALEVAQAKANVRAAKALFRAGGEDWRAALAFLERRERGIWGDGKDAANKALLPLIQTMPPDYLARLSAGEELAAVVADWAADMSKRLAQAPQASPQTSPQAQGAE